MSAPERRNPRFLMFLSVLTLALALTPALWQTVVAAPLSMADKKNCRDFTTWQEAQAYFLSSGANDPSRLDGNHNGIACESLPGAPTSAHASTPASAGSAAPSMTPTATPARETATAAAQMALPATARPSPTPPPSPRWPTRVPPGAPAAPESLDQADAPVDAPPPEPSATRPTAQPHAPTQQPELPQPPSLTSTVQSDHLPSVWLVALSPIDVTDEDGEVVTTLQAGDRARLIAIGDGVALVALADGVSSGWVELDPSVQLVAQ